MSKRQSKGKIPYSIEYILSSEIEKNVGRLKSARLSTQQVKGLKTPIKIVGEAILSTCNEELSESTSMCLYLKRKVLNMLL